MSCNQRSWSPRCLCSSRPMPRSHSAGRLASPARPHAIRYWAHTVSLHARTGRRRDPTHVIQVALDIWRLLLPVMIALLVFVVAWRIIHAATACSVCRRSSGDRMTVSAWFLDPTILVVFAGVVVVAIAIFLIAGRRGHRG